MAFAAPHTLNGTLTGGQEIPPNASAGTGTCTATIDDVTGMATFSGTFVGLASQATVAGLHGLAPAGATGPVLLAQTSLTTNASGTFSGSGTLSGIQVLGILAGEGYCEIDDARFPNGDVRGQLFVPFATAAPAANPYWMFALVVLLGIVGAAALHRRPSDGGRRVV